MPQTFPSHIEWIASNRGLELEAYLCRQGVELTPRDVLAVMVDADPSPGSHAVQWLHDTLLSGGYLWEDVAGGRTSKAGETLDLFARHRTGLPSHQRNLASHATLADLYAAMAPLLEATGVPAVAGGRALRRAEQRAALADSIVLSRTDDLIVAVPMTVQASQWWGRGTRWCTAADEHNMFKAYHLEAPIIVVVLPGIALGGKLQLYIDTHGRVQFMDALDRKVDPEHVWHHWDRLEPLIAWAVQRSPDMIGYVPPDSRTQHMCLAALAADGHNIHNVPDQLLSNAMCLAAVESNSRVFCQLVTGRSRPYLRYLDQDVCRAAVRDNAYNIGNVPKTLLTTELCMLAVQGNGAVLDMVPQEFMTPQLLMAAVGQNGNALQHVPEHLLTSELCMLAVVGHGKALHDVPGRFRTPQMVIVALAQNPSLLASTGVEDLDPTYLLDLATVCGQSLSRIPQQQRSREICAAAIANHHGAIAHVPRRFMDDDMCLPALGVDGTYLKQVDVDKRTAAMCRVAVAQNSYAIKFVPTRLFSRELCELAVQGVAISHKPTHDILEFMRMGNVLGLIPKQFRDYATCLACIEARPDSIQDVPSDILDKHLCRVAISASPAQIASLPRHLIEDDLWKASVERKPNLILHMPKALQDAEICARAIESRADNLECVRRDLLVPQLCMAAVLSNPRTIQWVPERIRAQVETMCRQATPVCYWTLDTLDGLRASLSGQPADAHGPGLDCTGPG